jgi:hypothetical protein
VLPSDDQYSFLHIKVFGLHNHLYGDPWAREDMYYIDKGWRVHKSVKNVNVSVSIRTLVWLLHLILLHISRCSAQSMEA